jgi:hypothetical protein
VLSKLRLLRHALLHGKKMLGDDRVRLCQVCSKNVYNLSAMTKDEAQTLVMDHQGKLCGLLYLRKDGSVMTADCPLGFGAIRRRLIKKVLKVAGVACGLIGLEQLLVAAWDEPLEPKTSEDTFQTMGLVSSNIKRIAK